MPEQANSFDIKKEAEKWRERWYRQRRVILSDEVNGESISKLSQQLIALDHSSNDPITLLIQSKGGNLNNAFNLQDVIRSIHSPVDGIILTDCASAAVTILQMCRKRYMLPSSRILVHFVRTTWTWVADDLKRLEDEISFNFERTKELTAWVLNLYLTRSGLAEEKLLELFRQGEIHGTYLTAQQAIRFKLADEIMNDFKFFPPDTNKPA